MKISRLLATVSALSALTLATPAFAGTPKFAVWLDGNTSAGGGGNGILTSLDNSFGVGSYTLVSTLDLETPGFLNAFQTIIVSRYGSSFGGSLSAAAAANVSAYVGSGATQGGVAVLTNDAADNLYGANTDPYDPNLNQLFVNSATYAAQSGHGYIGEFNGAVMALASNSGGFQALGLLQGNASALSGYGPQFTYDVGPIGTGNPIDAGVTFPFTDADASTFLTTVTGADPNNIVDIFTSAGINGVPAILANHFVISGGNEGAVPEPATWAMMLMGFGGIGFAVRRRRAPVSARA